MTNGSAFCYDATLSVHETSVKVQRMEHTFQFFSDDNEDENEGEGEGSGDSGRSFQFFSDEHESEGALEPEERILKVRLDKWLWAARFFKTRAVARNAVEKGKVFYNGQRSKPSREIEIGAVLQIRQGRFEKTVVVTGLSTRRRSTEEALQLFEETEESRSTREQMTEWSPSPQFGGVSPQYGGYAAETHHSQASQNSEYPRERRMVRFLRRSFVRGEQQPRQDMQPRQDTNHRERAPAYSNQRQPQNNKAPAYPNQEWSPSYSNQYYQQNKEPLSNYFSTPSKQTELEISDE